MLRYLVYEERNYRVNNIPVSSRFNWEIMVCEKGLIAPTFQIQQNEDYDLSTSCCWIFPPEIEHGWTGDGNSSKVLIFHFSSLDPRLEVLVRKEQFLKIALDTEKINQIIQINKYLHPHMSQPTPLTHIHFFKGLCDLSILLFKDYYDKPIEVYHNEIDVRLGRIFEWYVKNLKSNPTIYNIARSNYISESQLRRIIIQETGMSPKKYFNHLRLSRAIHVLHLTNCSIEEVARECGFPTPTEFCRFFKREKGISPLQWRMHLSKQDE